MLATICHFGTTPEDGKAHIDTTGTSGSTDVLSLAPTILTKKPGEEATCPWPGGILEGDFTLETSNGGPVTIDYAKTG